MGIRQSKTQVYDPFLVFSTGNLPAFYGTSTANTYYAFVLKRPTTTTQVNNSNVGLTMNTSNVFGYNSTTSETYVTGASTLSGGTSHLGTLYYQVLATGTKNW